MTGFQTLVTKKPKPNLLKRRYRGVAERQQDAEQQREHEHREEHRRVLEQPVLPAAQPTGVAPAGPDRAGRACGLGCAHGTGQGSSCGIGAHYRLSK